MIKVNKDFQDVPASLNSELTRQRRNELIENRAYTNEDIYGSRYKTDDIKARLEQIYHHKCAYCEKDLTDSFWHIEHYRPKKEYWWLAYSWDNLLLCCPECNVYKSKNFEIKGEKAAFSADDLERIHNLGSRYNESERPKLINPELENVEDRLEFTRSGQIESDDERVRYTIDTCKLDRPGANERRKKILDDFLKTYQGLIYFNSETSQINIRMQIAKFVKDFKNTQNEYLAFRRWIIRNLCELVST